MPATARASRKWIRSHADEKAVDEGCYFSMKAADRVRSFFARFLRHSKGEWAGKPFDLLDWQWRDLIAPLFGWLRADGTRRYRRAYISVPKKNGKSTLGSAISLYMLVGDHEPGAEVYCAAADREQASIIYTEAANMVEASPALARRLVVNRSIKRITFPEQRSWYKALSADVPTKEGLNIHALIFDELHAQRTRHLWDTLTYGGSARRQPLLIAITTAGFDRDTICYEQHRYAEGILDGNIEDSAFFALIAAAGPDDDWTSAETWRRANPSFGVTVNETTLAEDCREAQYSPAKQNTFRRYRLNQWTEQDVRWLDLDRWDQCSQEPGDLKGRACYAGLDLASTTDIAAFVLLFPPADGLSYYAVLPFFWVPASSCRTRERTNRVRLDQWIAEGLITATPGDVIDYDRIRQSINELGKIYDIREIAIDRWNSTQLAMQLQGDGFAMIGFGQGFASMTAPTKELESLVLGQKIRHGGQRVLRWMAANVAVEQDAAGNLKPSKRKSTEKIDGIVALIMALGRCLVRTEPASVYEERGLEYI